MNAAIRLTTVFGLFAAVASAQAKAVTYRCPPLHCTVVTGSEWRSLGTVERVSAFSKADAIARNLETCRARAVRRFSHGARVYLYSPSYRTLVAHDPIASACSALDSEWIERRCQAIDSVPVYDGDLPFRG